LNPRARASETTVIGGNHDLDTDLGSAGAVLDQVGVLRVSIDRGEALLLQAAVDWADLHPALDPADAAWDARRPWDPALGPVDDGTDEDLDGPTYDVPAVRWSAIPEFAARLGISTAAAQQMILECLEVRHRLPDLWTATQTGHVQAWRARRIAARTLHEPADVAAAVDKGVTPIAQRVGLVTIDKCIDEALLRLHPEEHELRREQAREHRRVDLHTDGSADGLATIDITTDTVDALDFDSAISLIARRLGEQGDPDTLDVRRAKAIGILADPESALALLNPGAAPKSPGAKPARPGRPARPRKQIVLHVHLSDAAITGSEPVGRLDTTRGPVLRETIREWAGREDAHLTVQPVIDLNQQVAVGQYEIPDRIKRRVELARPTCAHPWCNSPAERCDKDHVVPYDSGGATSTDNLAPLCRRHHRLKTLTAWDYEILAPATYLWTSPFGRKYLVDNTGTTDVTP
jgi:hypothetical protein